MRLGALAVTTALFVVPATASADRPASQGWYAEGGIGATGFLQAASADAAIGPSLDVRFGRDLFSFLSVGIFGAISSHEATVPPPPDGEWFQLYRMGGDVRIGGRFDRLALFIEGDVGAAIISSNVLDKVMITTPGSHFSLALQAGGGGEYQLENRHYAIGLGVDAALEPQFASIKALDTRLYLRYTY